MADLTFVFDHCSDWAKRVNEQIGSGGIFIFGSTITRNGDHFDEQKSDLDLVIIFPRQVATAPGRVEWLERLAKAKHELEVSLIPVLGREDAGTPMVSVVAVTEQEVRADIHKSPAPDFFRVNPFKSLLDLEAPAAPLLAAEPAKLSDAARQVVQLVQGFRNKYLGSCAAKRIAVKAWNGDDPIPKDVFGRFGCVSLRDDSNAVEPRVVPTHVGLMMHHLGELRHWNLVAQPKVGRFEATADDRSFWRASWPRPVALAQSGEPSAHLCVRADQIHRRTHRRVPAR